MKITAIQPYIRFSKWRNLILVKVETDDGLVGVGEATIRNKEKAVAETITAHIAPVLLGKDVFCINELFNRCYARDPWRSNGGVVFLTAISAVETALWDIIGKACGEPLGNLLGGTRIGKVPCYLNINGEAQQCHTDEEFVNAARKAKELGFRALKWNPMLGLLAHPEKSKVDAAIENTYVIRQAVGNDIGLMVDMGAMLTYEEAIRYMNATEAADLWFVEEPLYPDDTQGFARLAGKARTPLAAGERVFARYGQRYFVQRGELSILQPDLTHCGGILETQIIGSMAQSHHMLIAPHNSNGIVATVTAAIVDATMENFYMQECNSEILESNEKLLKNPICFENGCLVLPQGPGLGVEIDWEYFQSEEYHYAFSEYTASNQGQKG